MCTCEFGFRVFRSNRRLIQETQRYETSKKNTPTLSLVVVLVSTTTSYNRNAARDKMYNIQVHFKTIKNIDHIKVYSVDNKIKGAILW